MWSHDLTFDDSASNLALDEALLHDEERRESLRFWEPKAPLVVLGRSSRRAEEVRLEACAESDAPVLRRVSGGAAIVTGPGCLMYAVVLDITRRPLLDDLTATHRFVLGRMVDALSPFEPSAAIAGVSDLVVRHGDAPLKFSGNSLRRVRDRLLYHGTLLYDFPLPLVDRLLRTAPRQPDYRKGREHNDFVTNLNATRGQLIASIASTWSAIPAPIAPSLVDATQRLVTEKYSQASWNEMR